MVRTLLREALMEKWAVNQNLEAMTDSFNGKWSECGMKSTIRFILKLCLKCLIIELYSISR